MSEYIAEVSSLSDLKAILDSDIPEYGLVRPMFLTPEMADFLMDKNTQNRVIRANAVTNKVKDWNAGKNVGLASDIALAPGRYSDDWVIHDGQHTLASVADPKFTLAGLWVTLKVTSNRGYFMAVDRNAPRKFADDLAQFYRASDYEKKKWHVKYTDISMAIRGLVFTSTDSHDKAKTICAQDGLNVAATLDWDILRDLSYLASLVEEIFTVDGASVGLKNRKKLVPLKSAWAALYGLYTMERSQSLAIFKDVLQYSLTEDIEGMQAEIISFYNSKVNEGFSVSKIQNLIIEPVMNVLGTGDVDGDLDKYEWDSNGWTVQKNRISSVLKGD